MNRALLGIDHAVIQVKDLDAAREVYRKLGFTHVPQGNHLNAATGNYCIMFPETYMELLGVNEPNHPSAKEFQERLEKAGEGFQLLANGSSDADTTTKALKESGLAPVGPVLLERPQEQPKGMVTFQNVMLRAKELAGINTFFCNHKTPELMRTKEWMEHANGVVGVASATCVVDDVAAAKQALGKVYGPEMLKDAPHGCTADLPRSTQVLVTTPAQFGVLHPNAQPSPMALPAWSLLRLRVKDLGATAAYLSGKGIAATKLADGALRVGRADACGVLIEFIGGGAAAKL